MQLDPALIWRCVYALYRICCGAGQASSPVPQSHTRSALVECGRTAQQAIANGPLLDA